MVHAAFQILKISTNCDIPVRNSKDELILGPQTVWERKEIIDGTHGSLVPIAFPYDFTSDVGTTGALDIVLQPSSSRLFSGNYRLSGHIDGNRVLESDIFTISSTSDISVTAKVVLPKTHKTPFAWAGDCLWKLEVDGHTDEDLGATTRLELYWIAGDIHDLFLSGHAGIAVDFLRAVIPNLNFAGDKDVDRPEALARYDPYSATRNTFNNFSKVYDSAGGGRSFFLISNTPQYGGVFRYQYFVAARIGGRPGSLAPIVNCYDQAGMVQIVNSFGTIVPDRPSWLYMQPYGFITATYLVGLPGLCNNPFYPITRSPQYLENINDSRRTPFGNHAFNGRLARWSPTSDNIFDACGGPHVGDNPLSYVSYAIDRQTTLYTPTFQPGQLKNIVQCTGVTGTSPNRDAVDPLIAGKGLDILIQRATSTNPHSKVCLQSRWDNVSSWLRSVVDGDTTIAFSDIHHGSGFVETLWHLAGVEGVGDVVLDAKIHTPTGSTDLDLSRASAAALDSFRCYLANVQIDLGEESELLNTLWEPATVAFEYAQYAVQSASHIPQGRVVIVSGNTLISITAIGDSTTRASLEPFLKKVLSHTTISQPISLSTPKVDSTRLNIPASRQGTEVNVIKGIGVPFSVRCQVPHPISLASAYVENRGVLLKGYKTIAETGSELTTIEFDFVTWKVGSHEVELLFSMAETLTEGSHKVRVEVVEG